MNNKLGESKMTALALIIGITIGIFIGRDFPSNKAITACTLNEQVKIEYLKSECDRKNRLIKERDNLILLLERELKKLSRGVIIKNDTI